MGRGGRRLNPGDRREVIRIKGANYAMLRHEADLELTSPDGQVHYIIDGDCSCPDRFFRNRPCKHLISLAEAGLIPPISPVSSPPSTVARSLSCDELDLARLFGMA